MGASESVPSRGPSSERAVKRYRIDLELDDDLDPARMLAEIRQAAARAGGRVRVQCAGHYEAPATQAERFKALRSEVTRPFRRSR